MASADQHNKRMHGLDRRNAGVAQVLAKMRGGQSLHLTYEKYGPVWRLSGGERVGSRIAQIVTLDRDVAGVGDALFENALAQTYRFTRAYQRKRKD